LRDPNYIAEFSAMMKRHNQEAIYYAHAALGNCTCDLKLKKEKKASISLEA
jgi:hypothetical protein